MSDDTTIDDQSHYEISLTAGQAFVAFVLLLLSLAAAFAFGLLIGRGQTDDRMVLRKDAAVITEAGAAAKKKAPETVVTNDDFKPAPAEAASTAPPVRIEPVRQAKQAAAAPPPPARTDTAPALPAYAQLLSSSDQKAAEKLAAKLIEGGFTGAYVERMTTEKGTTFRVRVKFASEAEAHAAEAKLKAFSKDVWITKQEE